MDTLLFDLDGTLTDPEEGIIKCIQHALLALGQKTVQPQELREFIGPPLHESFATLLNSRDKTLIRLAIEFYRERFTQTGIYENRLYSGIQTLLAQLLDSGYSLYVATSKPEVFAKTIITHFGLESSFSAIYGSKLDGRLADKTELIHSLITRENVKPRKCCMIGDRKHDIIGALANGLPAIGALWGYGSENELNSAGANILCHSPDKLYDTIHTLQSRTIK